MTRGDNSLTLNLSAPTYGQDLLSLNTAIISVATRITPLIFIPGISGSRLVDKSTGAEVWPAIRRNTIDKLLLNPPQANIVATDAVRSITSEGIFGIGDVYETLLDRLRFDGGYVEYDVNKDPTRRTLGGCDTDGQRDKNPTLFVFAYDWRLSNAENAVKLAAYTECVRAFYPKTKIDILAHSMGGLLARRFVLDNDDHGVSKFVTIGSPLLGAPKALNVMYTGEFFDVFFADIWLRSKIKILAAYSKGIHELLPSREYFRLGGNPLVEKMSRPNGFERNFDFGGMSEVLGTQFPLSNPQLNVDTFHNHYGQDDWRIPEGSEIKYKHIYGIRKKADTMRALVVQRQPFTKTLLFKKEGIKRTLGDGTVPVLSAARKTEIDNLNAHGEGDVFSVYSLDENGGDAALTHTKLTSHPDVLNKVWSFLGIKQQPPSDTPLRAKSNRKRGTAMTKADEAPPGVGSPVDIYYLSVDGVAGDIVDLADPNGSVLRQVNDVGRVLDREGYSMRFSSEISRDFTFPTNTTVTLTFRSLESITVELLRGKRQDEPNSVVRHIQVPLPAGALVEIKTTPQGMELRYDADGDGICETEVPPTLVVTGEAARDITAPDVSIRVARQGTSSLATITIEAKDDETGIRSVRYWYDGDGEESDREYTGPFTVDSANAPSVFAVVWDNAGNNSVGERKIDFTLPSSSATLSPPAGPDGWNNTDVTVTLQAQNNAGGVGVRDIEYFSQGAQEVSSRITGNNGSFVISAEGVTQVFFSATDNAGNSEYGDSVTIRIDKKNPQTYKYTSIEDGQATIWFTATDERSGVAATFYTIDGGALQTYSAPFNLNTDQAHTITYYSVDVAGNVEAASSARVGGVLEFTDQRSESGIDTNGNGKLDWLQFTVGVQSSDAGYYRYAGDLRGADGTHIGQAQGWTQLYAGVQNITFDFNGSLIGDGDVNGPYTLHNVWIEGDHGERAAAETLFTTGAYTADQFETSPLSLLLDSAMTTAIGGDGDLFVEPGEGGTLNVRLQTNHGRARGVSSTLTTATPGVAITAATSSYSDIAPWTTQENAVPFAFSIAEGFECGQAVEFTLTITNATSGDNPNVIAFPVRVGQPTQPSSFSYTGSAMPIGGSSNTVDIPLVVSGMSSVISDLDFRFNGSACTAEAGATTVGLEYPEMSNINISLVSPRGTEVHLTSGRFTSGANANMCNTRFDDEAVEQASPELPAPYSGELLPSTSLAALDGEDANGTWILRVTGSDEIFGNVRAFSLLVSSYECDAGVSHRLAPIADAHVKGATPDTVYGDDTELEVKRALNPGTGKGRQSYLRFDTSPVVGNVSRAVLRVYGKLNALVEANNNIPCAVFPVSAAWDEATIVWNNKPAPNAPQELARVIVTDTTARWYEFDITAFINQERAAGRNVTGVLLRNMMAGEPGDYFTVFNSREAMANSPQLVIEK